MVEQFFEWDVDQNQFAGQLPPLDGVTLCDNLQAYVERKLFTLNTGHAITAYLGFIRGYGTILQSINDPEVEAVVKGAMEESAQVRVIGPSGQAVSALAMCPGTGGSIPGESV